MKKHLNILLLIFSIVFFGLRVYSQSMPVTTVDFETFYNRNAQYITPGSIISPSTPTALTTVVGTSQVDFTAGNQIDLKPGFSVQGLSSTARFHGIITP